MLVLALVGVLAASGCQDSRVGTVHGEVTLDGQPIPEGGIHFSPEAGDTPTAGEVIQDGKFTAKVPVGKHLVKISSMKKADRRRKAPEDDVDWIEQVPAKYNTKGTLTLEVKPGTQTVRYELKSK
jgi:hypothetical protein